MKCVYRGNDGRDDDGSKLAHLFPVALPVAFGVEERNGYSECQH